ncbi:MAG: ligand-binding SRPBCC domain-containing protein [Roseivirga sp.]
MHNIGFAKWRVQCFYDSLVQGSSSVFQVNICAVNPPLRKAENRSQSTHFLFQGQPMPTIKLQTHINANIKTVFDLSRSVDLHKLSTQQTNETAIAGKTSGLIGLNETVTWRAKHFGIYQKLTSKITAYDRPSYFVDEMISGAFKRFKHEHHFIESDGGTLMTDIFDYEAPFGVLGKLVDQIVLEKYMTNLLKARNKVLEEVAESDQWKEILT